MKLRNQLLALACLLGFGALGLLYFRTWVRPKPFGIILLLNDGLATRSLAAARLYAGGADHRLAADGLPHLALLRTSARDFAVPDEAAAASGLATGQPGAHRQLSLDGHGQPLRTLVELARREGRSVGLVTNGQLTSPGAAAFYAHATDASEPVPIAAQFLQQRALDLALGGGAAHFARQAGGPDPLAALLAQPGVTLVTNNAELESAPAYEATRLIGLFQPGDLAHAGDIESGSQQPSLADMVRRGIGFLQANRRGYLLVVEAALVTRAMERNDGERTLVEILAADQALATAIRYAGDGALIVATGRRGVGGLTLNGYPLRPDHGVALLGLSPAGYPALTWASGPGRRNEPAAATQPLALGHVEDVLALGRGPGAERLRGILDASELFELLRGAL
jgi:alkaline phosphatase